MDRFVSMTLPEEVKSAVMRLDKTPAEARTSRQRGWYESIERGQLPKLMVRIANKFDAALYDDEAPEITADLDAMMATINNLRPFRVITFAVIYREYECGCTYAESCDVIDGKLAHDAEFVDEVCALVSPEAVAHAGEVAADRRYRVSLAVCEFPA